MKQTPRAGEDLILVVPWGLAGIGLLLSHFLPHAGGPALMPWNALPFVPAVLWAALAFLIYVGIVRISPDFRRHPPLGSFRGWVILPFWVLLHLMLFAMIGGLFSGCVIVPAVLVAGAVALIAHPSNLFPGSYGHRVVCDLVALGSLAIAAAGARYAGWMHRETGSEFVEKRPWGPRWMWTLILSAFALGAVVIALAAFVGRIDPPLLQRVFYPAVER